MNTRPLLCAALLASLVSAAAAASTEDGQDAAPAKKPRPAKKAARSGPTLKLERAQLEAGGFLDAEAPAGQAYGHLTASLNWQPSRAWEWQASARLDGYLQSDPNADRLRADLGETFVRYRGDGLRVTLGAQNILWGRTDEIPPSDRLSRVDLNRFNLDPLTQRRRTVGALRVEKTLDDFKLDAVWVPVFQPAELPPWESIWHPVDRKRGRILGVDPSLLPPTVVQTATFGEDKHGAGGAGLRLTRTGGSFDWGISLQRARQSTPYYRFNNFAPGLPTFTAVHPMATVLGLEGEFQWGGATFRLEGARTLASPVTTTAFEYRLVPATDVVAGVEFFPGDRDTRITFQLASHRLSTSEALLERKTFNAATLDLEHPFAGDRWRFNLRGLIGLNHRDNYLSPRLTYRGFEPHEFYLAGHFYGGDDRGLGGFHRDHDLVVIGWQVRY
ncbi:DUF1302 family protein [Thiobacter aerophilum]|uniref:DUF1302 family protein n=1 Tax=Thiobacter aerophilum TaxID=3121275 RepID=A0ABV0ECS2_9BURK